METEILAQLQMFDRHHCRLIMITHDMSLFQFFMKKNEGWIVCIVFFKSCVFHGRQ